MNIYQNQIFSYLSWRFLLRKPQLREFLTNLIIPDQDIDISLFGITLRVNKRKEIGYFNAYKCSQGSIVFRDESASLLNLALILEPTDTFIDIGSNVGLYSAAISKIQYLYPNMKFYSFEPNPATAQRLRESLKNRNVEIFDFALSNREHTLEFVHGAVSGVFGVKEHISDFQISDRIQKVEARTLDSVGVVGNSIILKIDVEGHEGEVVEGASCLFDDGRIKAVYLDGYSDKELPNYLLSKGFNLFDGRTLQPSMAAEQSLLAIHHKYVIFS